MSERILKALMRLFAIVGVSDGEDGSTGDSRKIVEQFLLNLLSKGMVQEYLSLYDGYLNEHFGKGSSRRKRTSVNSVKVLKICTQINAELTQRQKVVVLIWLLEFIYFDNSVTEQELDFIDTVADTFNIDQPEYQSIRSFVGAEGTAGMEKLNLCIISSDIRQSDPLTKHISSPGLEGKICILNIKSINEYILRYFGEDSLYLNGQVIVPKRSNILSRGSTIRSSKIQPVYYSDITSIFLNELQYRKVQFAADNISFTFPNGNIGIHPLSIEEESGRMIGIMGGSGSGKSTLLNVLNGKYRPSTGAVTLNGYDIHDEKEMVKGQIGYVAQDDLLIEELTVYQNLYYTAKLCFAGLSEEELNEKVEGTLRDLGLFDRKDLKVGNPLQKMISGGQRKRLNIALELIREPTVLFVDEPTSGLSSRDSENIMDLLKELTLKGKLVFVVIHQPSSDLFKMFDRIFFLDYGGYPAFYGNPVDSVIYFKQKASFANSEEGDCFACGNVNPELVFNILEARVVDEYGIQTANRKVTPEEWYSAYKEENTSGKRGFRLEGELPETSFRIPGLLNQFKVFVTRDVLAKLTNRQYMLINLLEAPALAALLAFFLKYFTYVAGPESGNSYIFRLNENIPQFIFISVIVALFIGLTVSSEEIIKDKRIRNRESFLNLSRSSYISSKIAIMLGISAIQMILYVLVGAFVLEIKGMALFYWIGLFSTCSFANLLGLNVSANFNSAKVIYILIPVMIIPQLLFSGIIVSFDKLHPAFASEKGVPWIGNIMTSRWAYEGLAVAQFKHNDYGKEFYHLDQRRYFSNWKKDIWINALSNKVASIRRNLANDSESEKVAYDLSILHLELTKETDLINGLEFDYLDRLNLVDCNEAVLDETEKFLKLLIKHYRTVFNKADLEKENKIESMQSSADSKGADTGYRTLLDDYANESLEKFVTNKNGLKSVVEFEGEMVQKKDVIYSLADRKGLLHSNFYSPIKMVFNKPMDTFWANIIVIWSMTILLAITLYTDVFSVFRRWYENMKYRN